MICPRCSESIPVQVQRLIHLDAWKLVIEHGGFVVVHALAREDLRLGGAKWWRLFVWDFEIAATFALARNAKCLGVSHPGFRCGRVIPVRWVPPVAE